MSFDLAAWYCEAFMTPPEASAYYRHIDKDWIVIRRQPQFDVFIRELTARYSDPKTPAHAAESPDSVPRWFLETVEDQNARPSARPPLIKEMVEAFRRQASIPTKSPWEGTVSPTGSAVELSIRWEYVRATLPGIYYLAMHDGVTIYDPQSETTANPPECPRVDMREFMKVHLTLTISGKPPALKTILELDGHPVVQTVFPNRTEAHAKARQIATSDHLPFYAVVDPQSLAQSVRLEPVALGNTAPVGKPQKEPHGIEVFRLVVPGSRQ